MSERILHAKDFECFMILEFLGEINFLDTVPKLPSLVARIILKFYVNMTKDMGKPTSLNF